MIRVSFSGMVEKQELLQEIERLPEELVTEVLDYVRCLKKTRAIVEDSPEAIELASTLDNSAEFDANWWDNLNSFTSDFMVDRCQPQAPVRENIFP